jgi:membrane associated rhomboid family serine protease
VPPATVNLFDLTPAWPTQPWRLWTCHLVHFGAAHALLNLAALAAPFVLLPARGRLALGLALLAPVLSMLLLPGLDGGSYRGASGLACVAWAMAGPALVRRDRLLGGLWLGVLAAKLGLEAVRGSALLAGGTGWASLPAAHAWGALLGLIASPLVRVNPRGARV